MKLHCFFTVWDMAFAQLTVKTDISITGDMCEYYKSNETTD